MDSPKSGPTEDDAAFANCLHLHEPGCAVAAAPEIDPARLASYRKMVEDLRG